MKAMKWCTLLGLVVSSAVTAVGCSDDGDSGGVALADLPTEYAEAYCAWLYRCCSTGQVAHLADAPFGMAGTTEAECRTNTAALMTLIVPSLTESEGQGRLRYDPQATAACFNGWSSSCSSSPEICQSMVKPLVPTAGACGQDGECIDGACLGEVDGADGTCGSPQAIGAACEDDDDCASDYCDALDGVCATAETASTAAIGEGCFSDSACASGYCDYATDLCAEMPYAATCTL